MSNRRNTVIPCDAEGKAELFISSAALVQDSDRTSLFLKCYQLTSEVLAHMFTDPTELCLI